MFVAIGAFNYHFFCGTWIIKQDWLKSFIKSEAFAARTFISQFIFFLFC